MWIRRGARARGRSRGRSGDSKTNGSGGRKKHEGDEVLEGGHDRFGLEGSWLKVRGDECYIRAQYKRSYLAEELLCAVVLSTSICPVMSC